MYQNDRPLCHEHRKQLIELSSAMSCTSLETKGLQFPRATKEYAALGWRFDKNFREQIYQAIRDNEFSPSDEGIELVLGAAEKLLATAVYQEKTAPVEAHSVPKGHFWRGSVDRHVCQNCGQSYSKHLHTDEASLCPTSVDNEGRKS
jgi:hypothetical protein